MPSKRPTPGEWLKAARERRGISVRKVAALFDVSTQAVNGWEKGRYNFVSDERAEALAGLLGMDEIEVRRGLGLWVPREDRREREPGTLTPEEIIQRLKDDPEYRAEFFDALLDLRARGAIGKDDESD